MRTGTLRAVTASRSGLRAARLADYEDPYYWTRGAGFYDGKYPPWFPDDVNPAKAILERNYEAIRAEVLDFFEHRADRLRVNWLQWGYSIEGWRTLDLYSYGMRTPENCAHFPFLESVAKQVPGMMLVQVSVLQPHTRIRPHISETSALIRSHLPLLIPAPLPEVGIRVGAETRGWEEGKVIALNIAHRHEAWNLTDQPRIVVMVDCIHPDFADRQHEVEANALALSAMKGFASAYPRFKDVPDAVVHGTQAALAAAIRVVLWIQRTTGIALPALLSRWRPPGRRKPPPA